VNVLPRGQYARLAAQQSVQAKSDTIWDFLQEQMRSVRLAMAAMRWAKLLQDDVATKRGEQSPHEAVAEHAEERLQQATDGLLNDAEVKTVVEFLHKGWLYGDALLSWHQQHTDTTPPPVEVGALPVRKRAVARQ